MGIAGGLREKSIFMINLASPGFETMVMAVYMFGNCSEENFRVALSGMGEFFK
jgi:hypothetical protein